MDKLEQAAVGLLAQVEGERALEIQVERYVSCHRTMVAGNYWWS